MSILSVQNKLKLGTDDAGSCTYGNAWYKNGGKVGLDPGVEYIIPIPVGFNWVLFTYEPGGNSIQIKPDDGIAIGAITSTFTACIEQFNPPLKYIANDTGLRCLSELGADLTAHFSIGKPV